MYGPYSKRWVSVRLNMLLKGRPAARYAPTHDQRAPNCGAIPTNDQHNREGTVPTVPYQLPGRRPWVIVNSTRNPTLGALDLEAYSKNMVSQHRTGPAEHGEPSKTSLITPQAAGPG